MRTIREQTKTNPQLLDIPIEQLKAGLKKNITWLDQCFGRAWKITRQVGNKKYTEPCIYTGVGNEYESLVPSADLGNYSFFVLSDPTNLEDEFVEARCSLIVWADLRRCFDGDANRRDTEVLKEDLLRGLKQDIYVKGAWFIVDRVYEEAKNVFNGFTLDENDNQFMMQPYCGFRVDGTLRILIPTC